jgi:hypothetical protein
MVSVMVKHSVFFEVRTGFLNIIWTNFGFKGLNILMLFILSPTAYYVGTPTYRAVWSDAVRAGGASHGLIDALETSPSSITRFSRAWQHDQVYRLQGGPGLVS